MEREPGLKAPVFAFSMGSNLTKRIVVRVSDAQDAWITEQAADEGMDNATFVRVLIDRLSKGRPPLIGMMASRAVEIAPRIDDELYGTSPLHKAMPQLHQQPTDNPAVGDVLAQRAAEAEAAIEGQPVQQQDEAPSGAIPLRRIPRAVYNPGRQ